MAGDPIDKLRTALGDRVTASHGDKLQARCPAHEDNCASLSVDRGEKGGAVVHCHAGCETPAVMAALNLSMSVLMAPKVVTVKPSRVVERYDYNAADGTLCYQVERRDPKDFRHRRPDGRGGWIWTLEKDTPRVPYRLAQFAKARPASVFVFEGEKDVHAAEALGLTATTNSGGAGQWKASHTQALIDCGVQDVVVVPDNDAPGRKHAEHVAATCTAAGLTARIVELPNLPDKADVSDWLRNGGTKAALVALATTTPIWSTATTTTATTCAIQNTPAVTPCTLADVHTTFRRWLGDEYDLDAINVTLAAAAVERLQGDPLWLLIISGSGNAKTETVGALSATTAIITSTVSSDGALLSGTPRRETASDATGGLLRRIGDRGVLVIKDVTSILSMNRDLRGAVLAALREIYDGRWQRNIGTDGGRTLTWEGRLVVIGAVTTAWDRAADVISSMGDRFVLLRMDSTSGRVAAGRRAIGNTGHEVQMRQELAGAVAGLLHSVRDVQPGDLTEDEQERLLAAADVVTRARTGVEFDYRGDVTDCHAPEMPTRFAKQLAQVVRGAVVIGHDRPEALRLALRCARDSMPPMRLAILDDVAAHPGALTREVRQRIGKPRNTVDRQLQGLHMLGMLTCEEEPGATGTLWRYSLAYGIDPDVLAHVPDLSPHNTRDSLLLSGGRATDKSGTCFPPENANWAISAHAAQPEQAPCDNHGDPNTSAFLRGEDVRF